MSRKNNNHYIFIEATDRLPIIDKKNPKHYVFVNNITHQALNIWTEFIDSFPPIITNYKYDWEWLEEIKPFNKSEYEKDKLQRHNNFMKEKQTFEDFICEIIKYYNGTSEPHIRFADVEIYIPDIIKSLKEKYAVQKI